MQEKERIKGDEKIVGWLTGRIELAVPKWEGGEEQVEEQVEMASLGVDAATLTAPWIHLEIELLREHLTPYKVHVRMD